MRFTPGWEAHERDVRNELGLSATVGSGNQFYDKGDAVDRTYGSEFALQVECKYTEKGSFSVNRTKMTQWIKAARLSGRKFALAVRLWPRGQHTPEDYVVISLDDFSELLRSYRDAKEDALEARSYAD